ncbi:4-hydroxythreonine-4-phosphate dehydrogenase PdxA [Halobacteriales archaeon QH_6_64_20]|jgi:4-hydroxythreonine-4-phosphate dehydrogenase|nr:MAG: 4-hydroxythreonine-4-phosphate dehydrogenase PdxA [Halobacteriales archaeon QH_6_64_20]
MGDPGGIGAEVIVAAYPDLVEHARIVVIGDSEVLTTAVESRETDVEIRPVASAAAASADPEAIALLDLDNVSELVHGEVREEYGRASLEYVERAIELAQEGAIDAIATAPINKGATRLAGAEHAGHTGLLAERTGVSEYSMMLIEGPLRVTHVSTHVPLREAIDRVTTDRVASTIDVTDGALRDLGLENPTVAVAGLNPHAGEDGLLGSEDAGEIAPAVENARKGGIDVEGPISPDTVYVRAAGGEFDCVVSMYHDQGHIPIKTLGFGEDGTVSGVNVTIGLPIIRTSVDHGTAFDIAGEGVASPRSMIDAVRVAAQATRSRS